MMANSSGVANGRDASLLFVCTLCDGDEANFQHYPDISGHVRNVHKVSEEAVNSVIKAPGPDGLKSYRCILCSELFSGEFEFWPMKQIRKLTLNFTPHQERTRS